MEKENKNESHPENNRVTNKHIITSTATPRKIRDEKKQRITLPLNKAKVKSKTCKRTRPQLVYRNLVITMSQIIQYHSNTKWFYWNI